MHQHHPPASHLSNSHTPHLYDVVQCLPIDRIMFTFVYSSSLVSYDCNLTSLPNFHCNAHSWKFVGSRFQTPISNWFPFLANRCASVVPDRWVPLGEKQLPRTSLAHPSRVVVLGWEKLTLDVDLIISTSDIVKVANVTWHTVAKATSQIIGSISTIKSIIISSWFSTTTAIPLFAAAAAEQP